MGNIQNIIERANSIKNEVKPRANTADRVGGVLVDVAEFVKDAASNIDDSLSNSIESISTKESIEDGGENKVTINQRNGQKNSFVVRNGKTGSRGEKGEKGDSFTFADFTPVELASLKGEKGDKGDSGIQGERGERGEKGDMGSIAKVGVSVDSTVGTPSATATVSKNSDGSTNIDFSFTGLKGKDGTGDGIVNNPDDEDLTSAKENNRDVIKFADRAYAPTTFSGKGYKILRKNVQGKSNILAQSMFDKFNDTTIEIRYDYDLDGQTVKIPKNCILYFNGGSLKNGTLEGDNTIIRSSKYSIFTNVKLSGNWNTFDFYVEWFGAVGDGVSDDTEAIQKTLDVAITVTLPFHIVVHLNQSYRITDTLNVHAETTIKGSYVGSYMNYAKTAYKCLIVDFDDNKKWAIQNSNFKNIAYNETVGRNEIDSGKFKYQECIRIDGIKIECINSNSYYFGGIRLAGSSNSSIKNCCIYDACYGIERTATWYSSDNDNFISAVICALYFGPDMNSFSLYNSYLSCSRSKSLPEWTDENILKRDKSFNYKKSILCEYARGTIMNAITEHADISRVYSHSDINDIGGWIEGCTQAYYVCLGTALNIIGQHLEGGIDYIVTQDSCNVELIGCYPIHNTQKIDVWSGFTRLLCNKTKNISQVYNSYCGTILFCRDDKRVYSWNGTYWCGMDGKGVQTKYNGTFDSIPYEHDLKNGSVYMRSDFNEDIPIFQKKEGRFPYINLDPVYSKTVTSNIPYKVTVFGKQYNGTIIFKDLHANENSSSYYLNQVLKRIAEARDFTVGYYTVFYNDWANDSNFKNFSNDDIFSIIRTDTNESLKGVIYGGFTYYRPVKQTYVDALGFSANLRHRGKTEERPTPDSTDEGFEYYDSTLKKKILWNGTEWVNLDGSSLV